MKHFKKSFLILIFLVVSFFGKSQLTVNNLMSYLKNNSWDNVNRALLAKGFTYHTSSADKENIFGNEYKIDRTIYAWKKNGYDDKAESWMYVTSSNNNCFSVVYQVHDQSTANSIRTGILSYGFKKSNTVVEDDKITETYDLGKYNAELTSSTKKSDDYMAYNNVSSTIFKINITITGYLTENVEREIVTYHDNGQVNTMYKKLGGDIIGEYRKFFDDGQLEISRIFKDGKRNGPFIEVSDDRTLKLVGKYENGEIHGIVKEFSIDYNGVESLFKETEYVNGKVSGRVTLYDNGKTIGFFTLKNGELNGKYDQTDDEGSRRQGTFVNSKKEGLEILTYNSSDGIEYYVEQHFKNGYLHGSNSVYTYNIENNTKELLKKETYLNGVLDGAFIENTVDSKIEGNYKNGKEEGLVITTVKASDALSAINAYAIIKSNYKNGVLEGAQIISLKNIDDGSETIVKKRNYVNGELNGPFIEFEQYKINIGTYKDDEYNGAFKSYSNIFYQLEGKFGIDTTGTYMYEEGIYFNGRKNGHWNMYSGLTENDTLAKGSYDHGIKSGLWSYYHSKLLNYDLDESAGIANYKGALHYTANYYDDLIHGKKIYYTQLGNYIGKCDNGMDTCEVRYIQTGENFYTYKNGELNGPSVIYDEQMNPIFNGSLTENGFYGKCTFYNSNEPYAMDIKEAFFDETSYTKIVAEFDSEARYHGSIKHYEGDEIVYISNYSHGSLNGPSEFFNNDGQRLYSLEFNKGILSSGKIYVQDKLKTEIEFTIYDNNYRYSVKNYYDEGSKFTEYECKYITSPDDIFIAIYTGKTTDIKNGFERLLDPNGYLIKETYWVKNELVNSSIYSYNEDVKVITNLTKFTSTPQSTSSELVNLDGAPKKMNDPVIIGLNRTSENMFVLMDNEIYKGWMGSLSKVNVKLLNEAESHTGNDKLFCIVVNKYDIPLNEEVTVGIDNLVYKGKVKNGLFDGKVLVYKSFELKELVKEVKFKNGVLRE